MNVPNGPELEMVNVPPEMSSADSFLVRARVARSLISRAMARRRLSSASWMTGASRPSKSRSTAMAEVDVVVHDELAVADGGVQVGEVAQGVDRPPGR